MVSISHTASSRNIVNKNFDSLEQRHCFATPRSGSETQDRCVIGIQGNYWCMEL
ncbi:MAG TPA: hypothetical protein VL201_04220 [Patescibacteria group bacterium]|nr:hypothetical protein [Patescibacteria group bacterium]